MKEVDYVKVSSNNLSENWKLELTDFARSQNLNETIVSEQIQSLLIGDLSTQYLEGEFNVNVFVKLENEFRNNPLRISDLPIIFNNKNYRVGDLVSIEKIYVPSVISRTNGLITLPITVNLKEVHKENVDAIFRDIENNILPSILNKHYISYELYGESYSEEKTLMSMIKFGLLGLAIVYLILSIMFNSYKLPLLIMSIIPFSLSGALWGHLLMDYNLSILSIFSIFGLGGIVVNSSIVLMHLYNENIKKYNDKFTAIYMSVTERIRPILLTTLTTIIGLLPLLLNKQAEADFLIPMAISMVFGITFSFLVIIYLLPAFLALGSKTKTINELNSLTKNMTDKKISQKQKLIKLAKLNYKKGLIKKEQLLSINQIDESDSFKIKKINSILTKNINQIRG